MNDHPPHLLSQCVCKNVKICVHVINGMYSQNNGVMGCGGNVGGGGVGVGVGVGSNNKTHPWARVTAQETKVCVGVNK